MKERIEFYYDSQIQELSASAERPASSFQQDGESPVWLS